MVKKALAILKELSQIIQEQETLIEKHGEPFRAVCPKCENIFDCSRESLNDGRRSVINEKR